MYKLLTFSLLFIYSQTSFSDTVTSHAEKIVDSLYIVELSVDGVVNYLKTEWSDVPNVELGLKCFEYEVSPKLNQYFVDVYTLVMASMEVDSSIAKKELLDASEWLKVNGPLMSNKWVSEIDKYQGVIQRALGVCFELE